MIWWLLICAGLGGLYVAICWTRRRRRTKRRKAAWLRSYEEERLRRWKGGLWWQ